MTSSQLDAIMEDMMAVKLHAPIKPFRGWRGVDKYGSGSFGASRDGGGRWHIGADAIALPGEAAFSPITGKVDKLGTCYAGDIYRYVRIVGNGAYTGTIVRVLYVEPRVVEGEGVAAGEQIGLVQDISKRDVGITPHVHIEIWKAIDPSGVVG